MTADTAVRHTEASMLRLLRARHAQDAGNGPAWAYLEHVRDDSGFAAKRTADALAIHLWRSRGHEMHGFEVKVSRSDWLRELADPAKAEGWMGVCDRWWLVAPRGIARAEEMPTGWGLIETHGTGLRTTVQAPKLREQAHRTLTRGMVICMLRAAGAGLTVTPEQAEIAAAKERGVQQGRADVLREQVRWQELYEQQNARRAELETWKREIEAVLGMPMNVWSVEPDERRRSVTQALTVVLNSDTAVNAARLRLEASAAELEREAARLRRMLEPTP